MAIYNIYSQYYFLDFLILCLEFRINANISGHLEYSNLFAIFMNFLDDILQNFIHISYQHVQMILNKMCLIYPLL